MHRLVLFFAAACCFEAIIAADTVLPTDGKAVGVVRSDEAGKWIVLSGKLLPVQPVILDEGRACFFEGEPGGTYAVIKIPAGDGQPTVNTITLGGSVPPAPPNPNPTPPGPTPNPPPGPSPNPNPTTGPRVAVLLVQSGEQSVALGTTIRDLRSGAAEKYLKDNKHVLHIADDDNRVFQSWKTAAGSLARPVLMIADPVTNQMLHRESLPADATADNVIEIIKRTGG